MRVQIPNKQQNKNQNAMLQYDQSHNYLASLAYMT